MCSNACIWLVWINFLRVSSKFRINFLRDKKKKPTRARPTINQVHGKAPSPKRLEPNPMDQFTQILHTHRLTAQPGRMRVVQSRMLTSPNLQFCHSSPPISLNPPFLVLLPPNQYPSLKNQTFPPIPHKPTSSFPFGSLTKASMASSTTPSTATETETKPFSVLFVCLGNICRSPAAEGVFRDLVKKRGFDSKFNIDSAGTIDYHEVGTLSFNYAPLFIWLLRKQGKIGTVIVLTKIVFLLL